MDKILDNSEEIKNILESLAILVAATWTIFRFGLFRERFAKIEFNLDCNYIGPTTDAHVVELIAVIENKGMVRQYIKEWTFDLLLFNEMDNIDENEKKINYQIKFPNKKISKRRWLPANWEATFVDAGTKQVYTYTTSIPAEVRFFNLYSRFLYPRTKDFHSSQKIFYLENLIKKNNS